MDTMASQITSITIVYSTLYSDADQRKHQSSASLAFVWGIHRGPVNSPHKWPVTRKMFPFDDVIMDYCAIIFKIMTRCFCLPIQGASSWKGRPYIGWSYWRRLRRPAERSGTRDIRKQENRSSSSSKLPISLELMKILTAPSHYLNQCWLIISKDLWQAPVGYFKRDTPSINWWH